MISFFAGGLPHFADHLAPIWKALPPAIRGPFHARGRAANRAVQLGLDPDKTTPRRAPLVVVASIQDHRAIEGPTVMVNHGTGQTYSDGKGLQHPAYSGGRERERVLLHLCPSLRDAQNVKGPAAVVGVPKLDPYHPPVTYVTGPNPTVAISFHADLHLCPETRWAFPHYSEALVDLAEKRRWNLLGHAHPRMRGFLEPFWKQLRVPFAPHFDEVLDKADLYVCDNSSTLYEFASTGRPVLVLNAPWFRKDVWHGLRFWEAIPGIQVDLPDDLEPGIEWALEDDDMTAKMRQRAVATAYDGVELDGRATERAVKALVDLWERFDARR